MKLKTPPLAPRSSISSPMTTRTEQTTSSHERWLQTSFKLVSTGFMGLKSEEILYLKMWWHAARPPTDPERCQEILTERLPPGCNRLLQAIADLAVLHAVGEINDLPDNQPNDQTYPCNSVQASHES